jgi:acyl carrier protein
MSPDPSPRPSTDRKKTGEHPHDRAILEALGEAAPDVDTTALDPEKNFRDQFDFDSVDFLAFALALEKRFDRKIPELDYPKLSSLAGCRAYLG